MAGGRWNRKGTSVWYCSTTLSLACLEILVHVKEPRLPIDYASVRLDIPEDLIEDEPLCPADPRNEEECCDLGTDWIESDSGLAVRVPSAIISSEMNVLLKPLHKMFERIQLSEPAHFSFDPRLLKLGPILIPKEKRI